MVQKQSFIANEGTDHSYILPYKVKKVRLLESSVMTKRLLESPRTKESFSLLVKVLELVAAEDSRSYFSALLFHFSKTQQSESTKIYESVDLVEEAEVQEELLEELQSIIKVGKAERAGFYYDEKKNSYNFNANAFAKYFISRCHVRSTKDGRLFFYKNGVYDELSAVELGKIIRTLMHEGLWNSWKSNLEVEVVKALQRESIIVNEMNANRNFINLKNGMLSLDSYELLPHHHNYLSTIQLPIDYNPNVSAPILMKFMRETSLDDNELVCVIQEIMGYLLSAETKAEKAFYFYGGGANGKSVLASVITQLVGKENISSIPLSDFSQQFGLEGIINKTVNIAAENELGGKALKTENFKAMVSGDTININIKYRPVISYKSHCKLVFLVNNLPDSMDVTSGYFRKLMIVPFRRTFKPHERNVNLTQELLEELPGILNWAIEGLKRLRQNNYQFSPSKAIEACHETYYSEQNPVKEFFTEHVRVDGGERTRQADFHEKYVQWLSLQGIDDKGTKSRQMFWRNFKVVLENEGVSITKKKVKGTIYFDGLTIKGIDSFTLPTFPERF